MNDLINRALLCGMGLASLTKDAIRKTAEDLVDQSKITEDEGRRLVKELQRRSAQAEKILEKKIDAAVHKALGTLNLAVAGGRGRAAGKKGAGKKRRVGHARKAGSR